ncbi:MAG: LytTR family DNA-binding domain-containing protein [Lachnospiraceae bacterium]|nr:LytTR family DNA-binding domain-containing protein [Lachnospiraceae bacterium]
MIRIAVVEDEDASAMKLMGFIERYRLENGGNFRTVRFKDGDEIAEGYKDEFDIILMDIQMRFMDGMTAAEKIRQMDRKVVIMFITNRIDYAIRGYAVDAVDYVLKPVSYFAFASKLTRAIERASRSEGHMVVIPLASGYIRTNTEEIYYIESEGHNIVYHTKTGDYRIRGKMADLERELGPHGFFRCNKGYLVNLLHIGGVEGSACLVNGEKLLISRARKNDFMAALADYLGRT